MTLTIYQIDAFTDRPFGGNPAAVCLLPEAADEEWMQAVAAEMNLSETAFLAPRDEGFDLRWFTPTMEVDLCGHATLASAHMLWETNVLASGAEARFHTRSGLLTARQENSWIELDFPSTPAVETDMPPGLEAALGVTARFIGRSQFDYLIEVPDASIVRRMTPEFGALARFEARGFIVTALSDEPQYDFISRFFGPAAGVNEDPVTGSAHCTLAPFWAERLGKKTFAAYQASKRGGEVRVTLAGERVLLAGQAVTVFRGEGLTLVLR